MPFPSIDPVLIEIGPLAIRWYALAYVFGIWFGLFYMARLCRSPSLWGKAAPFTEDHVHEFFLWAVLGIILGGRLGYVLFYNLPYYLENPVRILMVWQGGMAFHGGLFGMAVAAWLYTRKNKLSFLSLGDALAAVAPIGLFLGRIANFINGELWGRATSMPWGVVFPGAGEMARHPSQLYEAFLEGLLLFFILRFCTHSWNLLRRPGLVMALFFAFYGAARIFVEFFREPDPQIGFLFGGWTMGMLLSLPLLAGGVILWVYLLAARAEGRDESA